MHIHFGHDRRAAGSWSTACAPARIANPGRSGLARWWRTWRGASCS